MIVIMTMVYFGCFTCNNCALDVITKNIPATGVKVSEFVLVRGFLPPPPLLTQLQKLDVFRALPLVVATPVVSIVLRALPIRATSRRRHFITTTATRHDIL